MVVSICAVPDHEALGRWLYLDRTYMGHIGCLGRLVLLGWGIELWLREEKRG